jgi:hypothetical protein
MAVSVNTVYRTVLLILNKEQRGYLTPDEFNRTATQVQLEIFNEYFEDLNQQLRIPENDNEFANRVKNLEEKISIFLTTSPTLPYSSGSFSVGNISNFYKLGTLIYNDEKEVQYVQPNELLELNLSPLTKPSVYWPVYDYRYPLIYVYPKTIQSKLKCTYIRKPADPLWNFTSTPPNYQYLFNPSVYDPITNPGGSTDFELHPTEQVNIITRILLYSGVIIKDPQIIQAASQQIQAENTNSKS